ncbi:abasic site processing protein HMCES-like [Macrobrachium nipponense]|uniref:abasic site processing protein HMCES-like n=1 Tax=Macrobrachium nipponense TaxID=159736 RepID=UPI0030C8ADFC
MCGRTSCTLSRDEWCQACSKLTFKNGKGRYTPANWTDPSDGSGYRQSANVAPSSYVPVLLRNKSGVKRTTEGEEKPSSPFSIEPMIWGLIPPFYQGSNPAGHGFKTNNCRIEGIDTKNTYKPSLHNGQRCVVLSDGFYEWETTKQSKTKQPYFIYVPQEEGVEIWNRKSWESDDLWTEEEGWKGPKTLKMAGLYSEWTSTEGIRTRSFSVITMESGKEFSKLHHRIPAILETDEQVEEWLDSGTFGYKEALQKLNNNPSLAWHPVSSNVNYSRNQDMNLNYPVDINKKPETGSSKFMSQWLSKGSSSPKKMKDKPQGPPPKKENTLDKWFKREKEVTKDEDEAD